MKERGITMLMHSAAIAAVLYILMVYAMKQPMNVAENRSLIIGASALIYMILFGHSLPTIKSA